MLLKILVVLLAIFAVAFVVRTWGRRDGAVERRQPPPARKAETQADETLRCTVCGAFVPVGTKAACARADCPFG